MTRPPGEGRARPVVTDGGPWAGYSTEEWVARIAAASTPVREYVDGRFVAWIGTTRPASRSGQNDSTGVSGAAVRRDESARTGTPDAPRPGSPSRAAVGCSSG